MNAFQGLTADTLPTLESGQTCGAKATRALSITAPTAPADATATTTRITLLCTATTAAWTQVGHLCCGANDDDEDEDL